MTLIEALKTGKRFRRRGETDYYDTYSELYFVVDEVMATDWEIEPTPVTLTREQFDQAWKEAVTDAGLDITYGIFYRFSDLVAKKLGL